jgi:hypothetical protein
LTRKPNEDHIALMVPCGVCGAPIDPSTANFDKAGRQVCRSCEARGVIVEGDMKATNSIWVSSLIIGISGLVSWSCFNPFGIVSVITVFSAIGWIVSANRLGPEYRRQLGGKLTAGWVMVIAALGIHLVVLAIMGLALVGWAVR